MQRKPRVIVIGAGIGGIAAAAALRKLGVEVAVYERASDLGEVGAGVQLGPNGVKVLRALGLDPTLEGLAFEPTEIVSVDWQTASQRFRQPLKAIATKQFGAPYLTAHRADLHRLLRAKVPDSVITLNARCTAVSSSDRGAVATFADGSTVDADLIVGADGIRSVVRECLFGAAPARFTEQIGWRAILPIELVPTRVGPDKSVRIERTEYVGWIGPVGHVICYPIRGGNLYNMFVGRVSSEWAEESWTAPSNKEEMLTAFAGWNEALLGMLSNVQHVFKWGIYDRDPLTQWTRGRVTLLGDAAHPMMPTLAQGASITLEDAYTFARNVARYANDPVATLKGYESERIDRARRVQLQARDQFNNNRKQPAPPPLSRDWIFQHDATAEPMALAG
jgi:2-polyprenyl-6-methoxyphenol hydroxylase-like FAD-dependent oxidoreductase